MSRRVLVVDDEYDLLQAICGFLEDEGFEVQACSSGEQALALLGDGAAPDVVLLDVMMPGLSGFQVAERIRAQHGPDRPAVVMMSAASPDSGARSDLWKAFLRKPFEIEKLLETVERYAGG